MAKKCGVIVATAEKWRFQLPVLSALIKCSTMFTMEQYSSLKENMLDFPLVSDLNASCAQNQTIQIFFKLGEDLRDVLVFHNSRNTTSDSSSQFLLVKVAALLTGTGVVPPHKFRPHQSKEGFYTKLMGSYSFVV